ncbi:MAG: thiamine diphosphokinase [Granulosicoccus sp.]|nr:thiamine diphosphokinase [Granulosicoccus sp.]
MAESDTSRQAIIFVNGECDAETLATLPLNSNSVLIAVDGGLKHVKTINREPDYLIGDMDSVDRADHARLVQSRRTTVIPHPPEKDSTDLELTLEFAATLELSSVVLVGVMGGRLDQALANILLLGGSVWPYTIDIVSADGNGYLLTPQRAFGRALKSGTVLSLLPLSNDVDGVTTEGLYYPLRNARLPFGSSLGISNEVNGTVTSVSLKTGRLLLVLPHHRSGGDGAIQAMA